MRQRSGSIYRGQTSSKPWQYEYNIIRTIRANITDDQMTVCCRVSFDVSTLMSGHHRSRVMIITLSDYHRAVAMGPRPWAAIGSSRYLRGDVMTVQHYHHRASVLRGSPGLVRDHQESSVLIRAHQSSSKLIKVRRSSSKLVEARPTSRLDTA